MKNTTHLSIVFGLLTLLICPKSSYADGGWGQEAGHHGTHQYYHYHDHPRYGLHVAHFYPNEYFPIWVGGARYYYDDGIYYNYVDGDYVVITPPVGAVVSTLPSDFQPVVINGVTYYTNNGVYYVYTPSGYKVVTAPALQAATAEVVTQNTVTINVPNNGGGYVAVILKRSGSGYLGPQGEFYPGLPTVSQLKMMYGR